MSQEIWGTIVANATSGSMLVDLLIKFKNALMSGCSGTARPTNLQAGGMWVNTTNAGSPTNYYSVMLYTGTIDAEIFRLSITNNYGGLAIADSEFDISEIADDTGQAIFELVKQRVATNGQDFSGDVIGELRVVGQTATNTSPTVAYLRFTSGDNMTASASGGTFSMASIPDSTSIIAEHLRFLGGMIEAVLPLKLNALDHSVQSIATAATIASLSSNKEIVEMTGSTATDIQGIDSTGASQVVTIHNKSTATVTFKHEDVSATAGNRFKLPNGIDIPIAPDATATFYYCSADTRWKIKDAANAAEVTNTIEIISGVAKSWTAPATTNRICITCWPKTFGLLAPSYGTKFVDTFGNMYMWGVNSSGNSGTGNVIPHSSPVAVIGGIQFSQTTENVSTNGEMYAWGANGKGQLGVGDVLPRSSPVAVMGGLIFTATQFVGLSTMAMTGNGKLYGWGQNFNGLLGTGDTVSHSSPVAVLGGYSFAQFFCDSNRTLALTDTGDMYVWGTNIGSDMGTGDSNNYSSPVAVIGGLKFSKFGDVEGSGLSVLALTDSGDLYAWGDNARGDLGVGDTIGRSSPVAVVGGIKFANIPSIVATSSYALTADGVLYSWGRNNAGQLGIGDRVDRSSPVAVLGGLKFRKVSAAGGDSVFGVTFDGDLYAWGDNSLGALGVGDMLNRSSPVAVLGGLKWLDVLPLGARTFGVTIDGAIYSWGSDDGNGSLGQGLCGNITSSPVAVVGPALIGAPPAPKKIIMDVVPGATYNVSLAQSSKAFFGNTPLDANLDYITIEYFK